MRLRFSRNSGPFETRTNALRTRRQATLIKEKSGIFGNDFG